VRISFHWTENDVYREVSLPMATMKAARIHAWGSQDIVLDEILVPEPQGDQVLIRVRASSINPVDWKAQLGYMPHLPLPYTFGSGFKVGDAVFAKTGPGGIAEYVTVSANNIALITRSLDYRTSATLPAAGMTAWQGLFDHGNLLAGQKVLVQDAAGGVGHFAVQLAKWKGAYVIGTGSAENEAFIRELGADVFINYRTTRFEDVVQDADIVLDAVGGETLERSYAATKPGGIAISIAGRHNAEKAKERRVRTAGFSSTGLRDQMTELAALIDAGHVKPTVSAVYPLAQVSEVLIKNKDGHTRGKIVIDIP
jgi:NADPH:quinone reductase-like Zn-dependent oxidoreductase